MKTLLISIFLLIITLQGRATPYPPDTINFYEHWAGDAFNALQKMPCHSNHLWQRAGWWNCANILDASLDHGRMTAFDVQKIYRANRRKKRGNFKNNYYDDEMWWAITWLKAYGIFNKKEYLETAQGIFKDAATTWDSTCNGGVKWRMEGKYKNAVTNELFLLLAARLAKHCPDAEKKAYYKAWAIKSWLWIKNSGMINQNYLVNDGLDKNCHNNKGTTWSYNQGVILGGLKELFTLTNDSSYLNQAKLMAFASIKALSDSSGILTEPCKNCGGGDLVQFKGIYIRYLALLSNDCGDGTISQFIVKNAISLWEHDRDDKNRFDMLWQGPFKGWSGSAQGSALDLLNAAAKGFRD